MATRREWWWRRRTKVSVCVKPLEPILGASQETLGADDVTGRLGNESAESIPTAWHVVKDEPSEGEEDEVRGLGESCG